MALFYVAMPTSQRRPIQLLFVILLSGTLDKLSFTTVSHQLLPFLQLVLLQISLFFRQFTLLLSLSVQALMDEILMLQDEIGELQTCFSE